MLMKQIHIVFTIRERAGSFSGHVFPSSSVSFLPSARVLLGLPQCGSDWSDLALPVAQHLGDRAVRGSETANVLRGRCTWKKHGMEKP